MVTSPPRRMLTTLLSRNSTHNTPMLCIVSARPSRATHTNLLTSLRHNGQALSHQFWKLRRAPPSFTTSPRTYACASCECSCPALVLHLKHSFPDEHIPSRGVGCPI